MGISLIGLALACILAFLAKFFRRQITKASYSSLKLILEPMGWAPFHHLPRFCFLLAFFLLLAALVDPHRNKVVELAADNLKEGVELFLVLDISGSMQAMTSSGQTRLEVLKRVSREFIQKQKGNLIGAISFARSANILSLPTLDERYLMQAIDRLSFVKDQNEDGTAIGYALYKAAHLLAATKLSFDVKSQAVVLITDGIQDPNPLDRGRRLRTIEPVEAARFAKEQGIIFYLITVEPKLRTKDFEANLRLMQEAATLTKGKLYTVSHEDELKKVLDEINTLEKSPLQQKKIVVRDFGFSKQLLLFAGLMLFIAAILETTWLRRVP